jgi:hypothetical protein
MNTDHKQDQKLWSTQHSAFDRRNGVVLFYPHASSKDKLALPGLL